MMAVPSTVQIVSFSGASSEHVARWTIPFLSGSFLSGTALQQPVKSQQAQKTRSNPSHPPPPSWRAKIHAPALVRSRCNAAGNWPSARHLPALLGPHDQPFVPVQPVDSLRVHVPAFASQQHGQAPIAVAHMHSRQLSQTMPQHFIEYLPALVPQRPDRQLHNPRRVPLADSIGLLRPARQLPTRTRPYSFFETISCRICRSKLRSATSRFSRPTSSRNCRSSRNSLTPTPVYFRFYR